MSDKDVLAHFPKISKEAIDYATNTVLGDSKYIFVTAGRNKEAYCTHCDKSFATKEKIKHNTFGNCPKCKSRCQYKQAGRGRSYLTDRAVFLWFEKSKIDKDVVIASWIFCERDYRESYEDVTTKCDREKIYIFKMGGSESYDVYHWDGIKLDKRNKVYTTNNSNFRRTISNESAIRAIKGTPFEISGWEKYEINKITEYLSLFSEKPNIEALTKSGHIGIVRKKMNGSRTYRAINWNAKKLHDFFKISKNDYKMIMSDKRNIDALKGYNGLIHLYLWQQIRKNNEKIKFGEMIGICHTLYLDTYLDEFNEVRKYVSIKKMVNYIKKQFKIDHKRYGRPPQTLITWRDYINDLLNLGMTVDNSNLFPKELLKTHERTMRMVKIRNDELAQQEIRKRNEELKYLTFEYKGLLIRPPMTPDEIIQEGKKLDHCVGSYADRHAKGQTTIMFVRKKDEPNNPYYTVEIRNNNVMQVRGTNNKSATKEIDAFIKIFENTKLKKKKGSVAV